MRPTGPPGSPVQPPVPRSMGSQPGIIHPMAHSQPTPPVHPRTPDPPPPSPSPVNISLPGIRPPIAGPQPSMPPQGQTQPVQPMPMMTGSQSPIPMSTGGPQPNSLPSSAPASQTQQQQNQPGSQLPSKNNAKVTTVPKPIGVDPLLILQERENR